MLDLLLVSNNDDSLFIAELDIFSEFNFSCTKDTGTFSIKA